MTSKTVYVLGAGFSKPAGAPNQAELLEGITRLRGSRFKAKKDKLLSFLEGDLKIPRSKLADVALEDIYTPIDRCLADRSSFRGRDQKQLEDLRGCLDYLIAVVIRNALRSTSRAAYIDKFAAHLVRQAARRAELAEDGQTADQANAWDPFSVISLNWDILLDNALDDALHTHDMGVGFGDYDPFGVVDYCCYVSSYEEGDRRIRSGLWSLGARGYNIKLLKLHGSLNWLQCTNCQRLFTAFGEKIVVSEKIGKPCRHCLKHGTRAKLRGTLVTPTFLKDLSNFQLKLVWQNAGVELMEARKIVFIGYSLPHADFELRQLITRMIHPEASIHSVLLGRAPTFKEEVKRYKEFFPAHRLTFEKGGVEAFVRKLSDATES